MEGELCSVGMGGTLFKRKVVQFSLDIYTRISYEAFLLHRIVTRYALRIIDSHGNLHAIATIAIICITVGLAYFVHNISGTVAHSLKGKTI